MDEFLDNLRSPLLSRVDIKTAAYMFDVNPSNKKDEVIFAEILTNVEKAKALVGKKLNDADIISSTKILELTPLTYPLYFIHELNAKSSVVFEVEGLEEWFKKGRFVNPWTNVDFKIEEITLILRRICALRLTALTIENDGGETDKINDLFNVLNTIESFEQYENIIEKIRSLYRVEKVVYQDHGLTQAMARAIADLVIEHAEAEALLKKQLTLEREKTKLLQEQVDSNQRGQKLKDVVALAVVSVFVIASINSLWDYSSTTSALRKINKQQQMDENKAVEEIKHIITKRRQESPVLDSLITSPQYFSNQVQIQNERQLQELHKLQQSIMNRPIYTVDEPNVYGTIFFFVLLFFSLVLLLSPLKKTKT